jgi:hypothetical protein
MVFWSIDQNPLAGFGMTGANLDSLVLIAAPPTSSVNLWIDRLLEHHQSRPTAAMPPTPPSHLLPARTPPLRHARSVNAVRMVL